MECSRYLTLLLLSSLMFATKVLANIGEMDDFWKTRAEKARSFAEAAYESDPVAVTNAFNAEVHRAMPKNATRRSLRGTFRRGCRAQNPIDRCWRCDPNWANNRKKLATCAKGFGRNAGGGIDGDYYVVTDDSDDDVLNPKYGTLRWGVIQIPPLWITFERDMVIKLKQELIMASNKTIDGRGAVVHIAWGASLTLQFISNVIVHGIHIHDTVNTTGGLVRDRTDHYGFRTISDGDGINIYGASNVWVDHVSIYKCVDGIIDIIMGSTAITVSNSHFTEHNDVMLLGAADNCTLDKVMQVTLCFNHFGQGLVQRMPRVRHGFVHTVNNDYTQWIMYALGGSMRPTIISQGNRFTAPDNLNAKEVTKRDYAPESEWRKWHWTSDGDLLLNGAVFEPSGGSSSRDLTHAMTRFEVIKGKSGSAVARLTRHAGALNCKVGQPC